MARQLRRNYGNIYAKRRSNGWYGIYRDNYQRSTGSGGERSRAQLRLELHGHTESHGDFHESWKCRHQCAHKSENYRNLQRADERRYNDSHRDIYGGSGWHGRGIGERRGDLRSIREYGDVCACSEFADQHHVYGHD